MKTTNTATATRTDNSDRLIVNLGMGVDSTAMLIGMWKRGMKPDLIIWADTGSEKPETYAYAFILQAWLESISWPDITVVRLNAVRASYTTIAEACLQNETLPSLAFGGHACSLRWKVEQIDKFLMGVSRGVNKCDPWLPPQCTPGKTYTEIVTDANGKETKKKRRHCPAIKATKCIGYDNGPADSRRSVGNMEDDCFKYSYPLRDWGWERARCIEEIKAAGLPVPVKSACWMCPASKKWEVRWLAAKHPAKFLEAILIEDTAIMGKHGLTGSTKGLGRNWSWRTWAEDEGIIAVGGDEIIADRDEMLRLAADEKPANEANDCSSKPCFEGADCSDVVTLG